MACHLRKSTCGRPRYQRRPRRKRKTKIPNCMNTMELKGNWNIIRGKLKQRWARLTDDDLQYVEGKEAELIGRIQKRTGETRDSVEKVIDEVCSSCCGRE